MNSNKSPNTYPDAPLGSWVAYPPPQALHFSSGLSLTLDESADRAQRLLASVDGRERVLVDVDASLVGVNYKKPKVFQWKTPDGQIHRGLLTLPGSIAGSRPPLVIMPQSWLLSNVFRPDGETFSAYAQQALAARGIAVLQVCRCDLPVDRVGQPVEEIASMRTLTDSAIDELSRQKLVNSDKLGAIGFSRQGAITRTLLLAPGKYRLSAASENDSFPSGLADYYWMLFDEAAGDGGMGTSGEAVQVERFHGGSFWLNKAQWNGEAADLAAANATGAMLVLFHGVAATPFLQSVHYVTSAGAFLSAGRPIEFHDLPDAGHVIDRPRQRYASLSLNVDWMDFWLNDHERVDPQTDAGESKEQLAAQYARWRDMKSRWNRQRAWETAGHPAGSIPDPDFVIPRASMQR